MEITLLGFFAYPRLTAYSCTHTDWYVEQVLAIMCELLIVGNIGAGIGKLSLDVHY